MLIFRHFMQKCRNQSTKFHSISSPYCLVSKMFILAAFWIFLKTRPVIYWRKLTTFLYSVLTEYVAMKPRVCVCRRASAETGHHAAGGKLKF